MHHYFLLGYIILYAIVGVGLFSLYALIVPEDEKQNDRSWETPVDIALVLTGLAGMLFLYFVFDPYWLRVAWRPISIALAVMHVFMNLKGRKQILNSSKGDVGKAMVMKSDITTLFLIAPSLVLNLIYAFR